jgi:hypothetical protein
MKNKNIYTLGLLTILSFVELQAQSQYFRYYKNEKQYLEVSPNKVLVQFAKNIDINSFEPRFLQDLQYYQDNKKQK